MKKALITALCIILFSYFSTGCLWLMAGVVGVAVVTANIDEIQNADTNSTGTEAFDEHMSEEKAINEALAKPESEKIEVRESLSIDDIFDEYEGEITDN
ncbi:hypothetical protein [Maridesulfovibrio frigidus]|uniref:hypothetical protein n=1 Tax=Maridesulfovibrio frigidus TaxID=340956 RepID=UPI0004E10A36|nr:hypothetical protein [Maridesulfovibrio frigidus]